MKEELEICVKSLVTFKEFYDDMIKKVFMNRKILF